MRRHGLPLLLVLGSAIIAGCCGSGSTPASNGPATVNVKNDASASVGFSFSTIPPVKQGTVVTWTNGSSAPHCIMWDAQTPSSSPPPGANIAVFGPGASSNSWTAPTVTTQTTYAYHCCIHGTLMPGSITVTP